MYIPAWIPSSFVGGILYVYHISILGFHVSCPGEKKTKMRVFFSSPNLNLNFELKAIGGVQGEGVFLGNPKGRLGESPAFLKNPYYWASFQKWLANQFSLVNFLQEEEKFPAFQWNLI